MWTPSLMLRAYSTKDGHILWDVDTARDYQTKNGVAGKGGSIDGPGPVVVGGMLYVNYGYGFLGEAPGNVLLGGTLMNFRRRNHLRYRRAAL
jgi:polyvinyl alcohol dehydrogenase (cytochrome)